ncbi:MAG: hypothetical protein HUJ51_03935 [Eggerthellaceae bacterium]|nr:hypothetical protein [Eggerthellaceae bacterium]
MLESHHTTLEKNLLRSGLAGKQNSSYIYLSPSLSLELVLVAIQLSFLANLAAIAFVFFAVFAIAYIISFVPAFKMYARFAKLLSNSAALGA